MQTQKRQPDSPTDGRSNPRMTWWTCVPIHPYPSRLLRTLEVKFLRRSKKRWCCLFSCLTTRAVHFEVAQSLETESSPAAVTRFIARRGYPNTIVSNNGTNFVAAATEFKAFKHSWTSGTKLNWKWLSREKDRLEIKSSWSPTLWWNLGKAGSKLQESHDCNLGQPKPHWRGTQHNNVSYGTNTQLMTPDSSNDNPEDLTALTPNHFLLGRENASAPFMPSS